MAKDQINKQKEITDRELLDEINRKLDLLLACFGLAGAPRRTQRDREAWAKCEVRKYRDRKAKKQTLNGKGGD